MVLRCFIGDAYVNASRALHSFCVPVSRASTTISETNLLNSMKRVNFRGCEVKRKARESGVGGGDGREHPNCRQKMGQSAERERERQRIYNGCHQFLLPFFPPTLARSSAAHVSNKRIDSAKLSTLVPPLFALRFFFFILINMLRLYVRHSIQSIDSKAFFSLLFRSAFLPGALFMYILLCSSIYDKTK